MRRTVLIEHNPDKAIESAGPREGYNFDIRKHAI
jgi:hypothetical protein